MSTALMPSSDSQRLPQFESPQRDEADGGATDVDRLDSDELPLFEEAQPWDSTPLLKAIAELDIEFDCRACGRAGRVPRVWAGGRVRCAECRRPIRLPSERTAGFQPEPETASFGRVRRRLKARDPAAEAHLQAIAGWHQAAGLVGALALPFLLRDLNLSSGLFLTFAAVLVWVTGQLLGRYQQAGRWGVACLAIGLTFGVAIGAAQRALVPGALAVLVSGAWAAALLWALFGQAGSSVFRSEYLEAVEHGEPLRVPWSSSPLFYVPAGLLLGSAVGAWLLL